MHYLDCFLHNVWFQMERPIAVFREFYHKKYNGRKLTWLFNLSRCELSTNNCYRNKYILQVCRKFVVES